jgi:hypothetical protein
VSIELMTVAWRSDLPSGRKLVLLSLCDNANDQGECYPSMATIAKRCGMSERAAQGHVVELQKVGILSRVERHGRSTLYTINPRRICTPAESAPPQNLHPTPADSAPHPAESAPSVPAESAPITIIEPSLNHQYKHQPAKSRSSSIKADIFKVDDVDADVWQDFVALRKAKKAPLTKTAVDGIRAEADKAGLTLEAALRVCCERGWAGFKAGWVSGGDGVEGVAARGAPPETPHQRMVRERAEQFAPGVAIRRDGPAGGNQNFTLEADHARSIRVV